MGKIISGESFLIERSSIEIFGFLSDFTNFSPLMPDQVENWTASTDVCSFEIRGLASLGMRMTERIPHHKIIMTGEGKIPFSFSLITNIDAVRDDAANVRLVIDADMNPFIAMMAEKPLLDFVNLLSARLKQVMEAQ
jgi:carbon monoxide dehydrogenase subunit G